jgi:hypothetical protein
MSWWTAMLQLAGSARTGHVAGGAGEVVSLFGWFQAAEAGK